MSNLPHPNADAAAGDLFYPGSPAVTVADSPGAAGSRAVEFGEDGYSLAVNRMGFALGKNDEYQQARLEASIANPTFTAFVPAAGNGGLYQFSTVNMFVGDATYLPESQDVRDSLIAVLDGAYNDLLDAAGNKVVVREILDLTATSSIVGDTIGSGGDEDGFYESPIINFQAVHPVTGVVEDPAYVIPDGTTVVFAHGVSGTLDSLATSGQEHLMRSALVRGVIRGISGLDAAAFLTDGSRKAIGDFDMNSNSLRKVGEVTGVDGNPLVFGALNSYFVFEDALGLFELNRTETAVEGDILPLSIMGELNSRTALDAALHGQEGSSRSTRFLELNDVVTFNDSSGAVGWPTMTYARDGERRTISSGSLTATDGVDAVLVIDTGGNIDERLADSVQVGDLPIAHYLWDSGTPAFVFGVDIRWQMRGPITANEITVGNAAGCDFGPTEFQKAVDLASINALSDNAGPTTVLVKGTVEPGPGSGPVIVRGSITIRGEGKHCIVSTDPNNDSDNDIDFDGNRVIVEDLTISNASGTKTSDYAAFLNAGSGSVFRNLVISHSTDPFADVWKWTSAAWNVLLDNILVNSFDLALIMGSDGALTTHYLNNSVVRDIKVPAAGSTATFGVIAGGQGNLIDNVLIGAGAGAPSYGFLLGPGGRLLNSSIDMTGSAFSYAVRFLMNSAGTFGATGVVQNTFIRAGGITCSVNDANARVHLSVENCEFEDCAKALDLSEMTTFDGDSVVRMSGCTVDGCLTTIADNTKVKRFFFERNNCRNITGDGVVIGADAGGFIESNHVEGWGSGGTHGNLIRVIYGAVFWGVHIRGNNLNDGGAPSGSTMIYLGRTAQVEGNILEATTGNVLYGIFTQASGFPALPASVENTIADNTFGGMEWAVYIDGSSNYLYNGTRITGNQFSNNPQNGGAVKVVNAGSVLIYANTFFSSTGRGVQIDGTIVNGSHNVQVCGNSFTQIKGEATSGTISTIYVNSTVAGAGQAAHISDNHFTNCGTTNAAIVGSDEQAVIYVSNNAQAYLIQNNLINGLTGASATAPNADGSYGIYTRSRGVIQGNQIYKDFSVTGKVADVFIGIYVSAQGTRVAGNYIYWTGTQSDGNKSSEAYGINGGTVANLQIIGNYVDQWTIVGATLYAILADGNSVVFVGNTSVNEAGSVKGADGVVIGNVWTGANALSWGGTGTNKPSAGAYSGNGNEPYQDTNVNAVGHA